MAEGLADVLGGHGRVGIDTAIFIYRLEGHSRLASVAGEALTTMEAGRFEGITSSLTLMELAVRPLALGRPDVADEYDVLLANFPHLLMVDVDRRVARRAAELRAAHRLRPADALQVAACIDVGATAFLTNNRDLRRIDEVEVLLLSAYV